MRYVSILYYDNSVMPSLVVTESSYRCGLNIETYISFI